MRSGLSALSSGFYPPRIFFKNETLISKMGVLKPSEIQL